MAEQHSTATKKPSTQIKPISKVTASVSLALHGKLLQTLCCQTPLDPNKMKSQDPPSLTEIYNFIHGVAWRIQIEPECLIVALMYIDRAVELFAPEVLDGAVGSWDIAVLACMSLASCLWDDISASPRSFAIAAMRETKRNTYTARDIIAAEWALLDNPHVRLSVSPLDYRTYYYNLEKIWTRVGLVQCPSLQPILLHPTAILGLRLPDGWHMEYAMAGERVRKELRRGWNNMSLTHIYRHTFESKGKGKGKGGEREGEWQGAGGLVMGHCDASAGIGRMYQMVM